jgi:hypothetical protein
MHQKQSKLIYEQYLLIIVYIPTYQIIMYKRYMQDSMKGEGVCNRIYKMNFNSNLRRDSFIKFIYVICTELDFFVKK